MAAEEHDPGLYLGPGVTITDDPTPPAQFERGARWTADTSPERRLFLAVLCQALNDLRLGDRHDLSIRERARAWFASDRADWPGHFRSICDALGFDLGAVRAFAMRYERGEEEVITPDRWGMRKETKVQAR